MFVRAASLVTTVALAAGLLWWVVEPGAGAGFLLNAGLLVLLATPVAQLVGAVGEEVRAREWRFALAGAGVLLLLVISALVSIGKR